ncbi:hypothetical protein F5148DRAFT_1150032 [Russula earlei]|uniref:Uncharacterized protein n=1 Tax=Russula earlei TaxID=71964 RepID=A0ACC0U884_9AGAM|nr:hypothetical protein F5148DRAFT_1150032 [Russula earlei]
MSGKLYRRGSHDGGPRSFGVDSEPSFAQRLLLANENAVTNIADLWVAAAMNVDNEEVFENHDADMEGPFESVFDLDGDAQNDNPPGAEDTLTERGKGVAVPTGSSETEMHYPLRV